jgi:predicted nucleotidyltransferase
VVLYGSAARGQYREGASDLNVLVLLRDTLPATLRRGSRLARAWVEEERNPPPLLLSEEEWRGSADVFPIEMSDIRDAHLVLHGADPFTGVEIALEDLRLQCEHELKGKQIQLRERYLLSAGEPAELEQLLARSFSTFLVLFRTVLRLDGGEAPRDAETVVRRTAERAGVRPDAAAGGAPRARRSEARRARRRAGGGGVPGGDREGGWTRGPPGARRVSFRAVVVSTQRGRSGR